MTKALTLLGRTALAALCLAAEDAYARQTTDPATDIRQFQEAADAYAVLHRDVARTLPPPEISSDTGKIYQGIDRLALGIVSARMDAAPGDVFGPAAGIVRVTIRETLAARNVSVVSLLEAASNEGTRRRQAPLTINSRMPWAAGAFMPACLIAALPALPPELQYRFVGRTLVLVDVGAGLVVDLLPDALPEAETE